MTWTGSEIVYQIIMSNNHTPFYYEKDKLYLITSWSCGTVMYKKDLVQIHDTNKAEGKEIVSYGN
jgi:hypothetical protein